MLGLGFGLGLGGRASSSSTFNPATLTLNAWWKNYAGVIWSGTASAGDSGNRDLNISVDSAPDVTSLNSLGVAHFVAANGDAVVGDAVSNFITAAAGTMIVLVNATSSAASGGAHNDPAIWHGGSNLLLTFSNSGAQFCVFDGAQKTVTIACSTGAYHALTMRWDGTNLVGKVDSGATSSAACGNVSNITGTLTVGKHPGVAFFDCRIAELMFAPSYLSDGDVDDVISYFNTTYALSL